MEAGTGVAVVTEADAVRAERIAKLAEKAVEEAIKAATEAGNQADKSAIAAKEAQAEIIKSPTPEMARKANQAGNKDKRAAAAAFRMAAETDRKAETAAIAGDEAIETATQTLHRLLRRAEELAKETKEAGVSAHRCDSETKNQFAGAVDEKQYSMLLPLI